MTRERIEAVIAELIELARDQAVESERGDPAQAKQLKGELEQAARIVVLELAEAFNDLEEELDELKPKHAPGKAHCPPMQRRP
jgi:hypothetical protein